MNTNNHKLFRQFFRLSRESREIFEDAPEKSRRRPESVPKVLESLEKDRKHVEKVERFLDIEVRKSTDKTILDLWANDTTRKMIVAQVLRETDGSIHWLNETKQAHARAYDETISNPEEMIEGLKLTETRKIREFIASLNANIQSLKDGQTKFIDKGGGKAFPVDVNELRLILEKRSDKKFEDDFKSRQHNLIEIARVIVNTKTKEDLLQFLNNVLAKCAENDKKLTDPSLKRAPVLEELIKILTDEKGNLDDAKGKMYKVLEAAAKVDFSEADKQRINDDIQKLEKAIADADGDKQKILAAVFERQSQYLRLQGGDDNDGLIKNSILLDGRFDMELFTQRLKILGKPVDAATREKLMKAGHLNDVVELGKSVDDVAVAARLNEYGIDAKDYLGIAALTGVDLPKAIRDKTAYYLNILLNKGKAELIKELKLSPLLWNPLVAKVTERIPGASEDQILDLVVSEMLQFWNTKDLVDYMNKDLHLNNNAGFDFKKYVLRARLDNVAKFFINAGEKNIAVSDVLALSRIKDFAEGTTGFDNAAKNALFDYLGTNGMMSDYPKSRADVRKLVTAFNANTNDDTTRVALEQFLTIGLARSPERIKEINSVVKKGIPADSTVLERLMMGPLILDADQAALKQAIAEYKRTTAAPEKTLLTDFVTDKLKDYPLLLADALLLISPRKLDELELLLTKKRNFIDEDRKTIVENLVNKYQASVGTPSLVEREALMTYMKSLSLSPAELQGINDRLDSKDHLTQKALKEIFDYLAVKQSDGSFTMDKDRFVEFFSLIFIKGEPPTANEATLLEQSKADAEDFWKQLILLGTLTSRGADEFTVSSRDDFAIRLRSVKVGTRTIDIHKQLRDGKVQDVAWDGAAKMYMHQLGGTVWDTGEKWVGYMANLGSVFWSNRDKELLRTINMQEGLTTAGNALKAALAGPGQQEVDMQAYIAALKQDQIARAHLNEAVRPGLNPLENQEGAAALLKASARVITLLRSEHSWDSLPLSVKQSSFWLAMNKGKGDADAALFESTDFLAEYHRAPKAVRNYDIASLKFRQNPTSEENKGVLLQALQAYQMIGKIDESTLYKPYAAAIEAYYDALHPVQDQAAVNAAQKAYFDAERAYRTALNAVEKSRTGYDPGSGAYKDFFEAWMKKNPEDATGILQYMGGYENGEVLEGKNNLKLLWNKHRIATKPLEILALQKKRQSVTVSGVEGPAVSLAEDSFSFDKWLVDGHRDFARPALDLVLTEGKPGAKKALIDAFVEGRDTTYMSVNKMGLPEEVTITAAEAFYHVSEIQRLLQHKSDAYQPAYEYLKKQDFFENPFDKGLRATLETMEDLWNGDMVDKAKLFLGLFAAYKLITYIWAEGSKEDGAGWAKLAKWGGLIGIPLLMVANTAYKNQTGRDIMGETLLYLPESERNGLLEQWRRRGLSYDAERYKFLGHESGFASMQVLMDRDNPIEIGELIEWRDKIRGSSGGKRPTYEEHAPPVLKERIGRIMAQLPPGASREEAFKIAYYTFEAVCVDVAAMHDRDSGSVDQRANWGADYIYRSYIDKQSYDGEPEVQAALNMEHISIIDIIDSEEQLPSFKNSKKRNDTAAEWVADGIMSTPGKVMTGIRLAGAHAESLYLRGADASKELYKKGRNLLGYTTEAVVDWLKVTYPKAKETVIASFAAAWEALKGTGITIVEVTPGVFKFVVNGAINITSATLAKCKGFHDYLLLHEGVLGELRLLRQFEEFMLSSFGYDFMQELTPEEANKEIQDRIVQVANHYDGGQYSPIDGKGKYTYSRAYRGRRSPALSFGKTVGGSYKQITFDESKTFVADGMNTLSQKIFGEADSTKLSPAKQRFVLEVLQANLFKHIAVHPSFQMRFQAYKLEIDTLTAELTTAEERLKQDYPQIAKANAERAKIDKEVGTLLAASEADIAAFFENTRKDFERSANRLEEYMKTHVDLSARIAATPSTWANTLTLAQLNVQLNFASSNIDTEKVKRNAFSERLKQLYVFHELAKKIPNLPDRKNWADFRAKTAGVWVPATSYTIATYNVAGASKNVDLTGAQAIKIRNDSARLLERDETLVDEIKATTTDVQDLMASIQKKKSKIKGLKGMGVTDVQIEADPMFGGASDEKVIGTSKDKRAEDILQQVYKESGKLFVIPLEFVFGEAGEVANKRIETWIQRRLSYDLAYTKSLQTPANAPLNAAYERYLAHVGLNEMFMRGMLHEEGDGEKENPLHLSLDEAQDLDRYLEEGERLVSFTQFRDEIWATLKDTGKDILP